MASSSFNTFHQTLSFSSNPLCEYPSSVSTFNSPSFSAFPKYPLRLVRVREFSSTIRDNKTLKKPSFFMTQKVNQSGSHHLRSRNEGLVKKSVEDIVYSKVEEKNEKGFEKGKNFRSSLGFRKGMKIGSENSFLKSRSENGSLKPSGGLSNGEKIKEKSKKNQVVEKEKLSKDNNEIQFRVNLDMCSKNGDVMGAIKLYEWAQKEGIRVQQYHYTVILYLCSSAALGVVQPAKSGSANRTLSSLTLSKGSFENPVKSDEEFSKINSVLKSGCESLVRTELNTKNVINKLDGMVNGKENISQFANGSFQILDEKEDRRNDGRRYIENRNILVDEDFKKYALQKGFEIYEKMCAEEIPMNEATLTSVARMAMSMGDGDMAFNMVKQMKPLGINPRLRSYGPALSVFCNNVDIDKAFSVEKHMLEHGVYPEEPELEALLRISIKAGKADKVYYLLHKLRTAVRQVSPSTADLIVTWFKSKDATSVGKMKVDQERIEKAMENGGGGWHGLGWLGRGTWSVSSTNVGKDGLCKSCGEKLATIDLDPIETENFAESVATIARQREKNSSFQKFQKWLDYYGPFEAVIDAANVGLFSQRKFMPSKVNLIVNGIRQKLPSKKLPLIVLHNKRITGRKMDEPVNKTMIEKWKNADALYATPTGSNDDWYWLYAAIKFKCLLVTNDEMRDHTFQLLGNDFFPRWKERHQVHFNFSDSGPVFHMPPPCSVVIQESDKGHWHVPIVSEHSFEADRTWLCITRGESQSHAARQESSIKAEESQPLNKGNSTTQAKVQIKQRPSNKVEARDSPRENYNSLKQIFSASVSSNKCSLVSVIEDAEKLGGCTIDFQI